MATQTSPFEKRVQTLVADGQLDQEEVDDFFGFLSECIERGVKVPYASKTKFRLTLRGRTVDALARFDERNLPHA